jgi:hypothetical protein
LVKTFSPEGVKGQSGQYSFQSSFLCAKGEMGDSTKDGGALLTSQSPNLGLFFSASSFSSSVILAASASDWSASCCRQASSASWACLSDAAYVSHCTLSWSLTSFQGVWRLLIAAALSPFAPANWRRIALKASELKSGQVAVLGSDRSRAVGIRQC